MSNFGEELARQLATRNVTVPDFAHRVDMSASQIYNWLRGDQLTVSAEQFNVLAAALTDDEHDHARLLYAHLLDEKADALGQHLVEVSVLESSEVKDRPRARSKRERAIEILSSESVRDRVLADLLVSLAGYADPDLAKQPNSPRVHPRDTEDQVMDIITEKPASGDDSPPKSKR